MDVDTLIAELQKLSAAGHGKAHVGMWDYDGDFLWVEGAKVDRDGDVVLGTE